MSESLTKSHDRVKQLGEVYTPRALVIRMLRQLPVEAWIDPSKTFCDPSCGTGNFLVEVVSLKVKMGSTPLQALKTTYGVDIMQDNVDECRERLLAAAEKHSGQRRTDEWVEAVQRNVICGDSLRDETWERFDVQR